MQMLGVRGMAISMALTFGAVVWWATRGTNPAEGIAQVREAPASHAGGHSANAWLAPAGRDEPAVAPHPAGAEQDGGAASEANFAAYVDDKYRLLLETAGRPRATGTLRAALLERERIMVDINNARQGSDIAEQQTLPRRLEELAAADRKVGLLLPAADLAAFEVLKDSHIEQFQLDDYAQGISNVAPLRNADRRAILYSKLAHRHRFRQLLEQSGLMRGELPAEQRHAILSQVTRALRESRDGFLQEARQYLHDDEQYVLLSNYEHGEYAAELEKLRGMAWDQGG
jgi:hypothetical protein